MSAATILDCFQDVISIKGSCDDVVPSSGIYLDDVGLSLANLDEFVTKDYKDSYDLFTKKRDFALRLITNQINQHLSDRYLENTLLSGQRLGHYQDNLNLISGTAGKRKGISVEFCNEDSYVDLFVSEISIQIHYSGSATVKVYDLISGSLLDTIPFTAVSNKIVSVYPAKTYKSNRKKLHLIFVLEVLDANGQEVVVSSNTTYLNNGGCATCGGNVLSNRFLNARSIQISDASAKIKSNLESVADTAGISLVYSLNCNHQDWLCTISPSIAIPLAYKTAAELMSFCDDVASNERTDTFTFANGDKIKVRADKYDAKFSQAMDNLLKNIKLPSDLKCFVCNNRTSNKIVLP